MLDPQRQEGVLLAHDLAGDLEDGAHPLVQALHQPAGLGVAVGDKGALRLAPCRSRDAGMVAAVQQHAGQGVGVQLHPPHAEPVLADEDVRDYRLHGLRAEGGAGPRRKRAHLGDHLAQVLVVYPAEPAQRRPVALRQQRQVVEQGLHGRIEPIALGELQRETFAYVTGEHTHGIKALQARQHAVSPLQRAAEPRGHLGGIDPQIAALVDGVEHHRSDRSVRRRKAQ